MTDKKVEPEGSVVPSEEAEGANKSEETSVPPEILDRMPEPMREQIRETFGMISSGPMGSPISKKVTSEHIGTLIENGESESKRDHDYRTKGRRYSLAYVLLAIVSFFVFAAMFGKSDPDLFKQVITYLATFAAGFAGGWGINAARSSFRED